MSTTAAEGMMSLIFWREIPPARQTPGCSAPLPPSPPGGRGGGPGFPQASPRLLLRPSQPEALRPSGPPALRSSGPQVPRCVGSPGSGRGCAKWRRERSPSDRGEKGERARGSGRCRGGGSLPGFFQWKPEAPRARGQAFFFLSVSLSLSLFDPSSEFLSFRFEWDVRPSHSEGDLG